MKRELLSIIALIALFVILCLSIFSFAPDYMLDDSYISLRYARHLMGGGGLVFNIGEKPVEGYSNFLWILICATLGKLGFELLNSAVFLGVLFGIASIVVLFLILKSENLGSFCSLLGAGLLATSGPFILYSVSGLETSLFVFLISTSLFFTLRFLKSNAIGDSILMAISTFLLYLCRPEGILLFPIIWLFFLYQKNLAKKEKLILIPSIVLFTILVLIYNIWRVNYFGDFLPTPFYSKSSSNFGLLSSLNLNLKNFFKIQNHYFSPFGYYYLTLLIAAIAGIIFYRRSSNKNSNFLILNSVVVLVFSLVYLNFVDWMPAMRYYVAILIPLIICIAPLGRLIILNETVDKTFSLKILLFSVVLALGLFSYSQVRTDAYFASMESKTQKEIGLWLNKYFSKDNIIAVSDAGAIPYFSRMKTIDINPASLLDKHIAKEGWDKEYFFSKAPNIAIFVSFSLKRAAFYPEYRDLITDSRFQEEYALAGISRADFWQDRSYWIFLKKDIEVSKECLKKIPAGPGLWK